MDSDDKNVHGLPFKVVSTCYSPSRQKTLEASYDYICTYNWAIFAKLVAEREYQQIEVPLPCMSGLINVKVLRRSIKASKLDVSVKNARFCTLLLIY